MDALWPSNPCATRLCRRSLRIPRIHGRNAPAPRFRDRLPAPFVAFDPPCPSDCIKRCSRASKRITPATPKSPRRPCRKALGRSAAVCIKRGDPRSGQARRGDCEIRATIGRKTGRQGGRHPRPHRPPRRPRNGPVAAPHAPRRHRDTSTEWRALRRAVYACMSVQYFEPMDPGRAGDARAQLDELALLRRRRPARRSRSATADGIAPLSAEHSGLRASQVHRHGSHAIRLERATWREATRRARFMSALAAGAASPRRAVRP